MKSKKEYLGRVKIGVMLIVAMTISIAMMGNSMATTITPTVITGDDYATFNINITNATNLTDIKLYCSQNETNLTLIKEWNATEIGTNTTFTYNYTNLTVGTYYYEIEVTDNGTVTNTTGNFTIAINPIVTYFTGQNAYKTWILLLGFVSGLAMMSKKDYHKLGKIILIGTLILGAYWFVYPAIVGVIA